MNEEELEKDLMVSVKIKLKNKTGRPYESIDSLSLEYLSLFPNDTIGNNILSNLIRKKYLGMSVLDELEFLDKHFKS